MIRFQRRFAAFTVRSTKRLYFGFTLATAIQRGDMTVDHAAMDEDEQRAVGRLTEREKEVLRRWLDHRTAKEMALDLGISHYAVEKRLRMARAKLGVTSSIEAARLLEAAEGYKRAGAQSPDLVVGEAAGQKGFTRKQRLGVLVMFLVTTTALAVLLQSGNDPAGAAFDPELNPDHEMLPATEAEIAHITQATFHHLDANNSGYLEGAESPLVASDEPQPVYTRGEDGKPVPTGETIVTSQAELTAGFYREADRDGDGKVSFPEYHQWSAPNLARSGIPATWREEMGKWMTSGT